MNKPEKLITINLYDIDNIPVVEFNDLLRYTNPRVERQYYTILQKIQVLKLKIELYELTADKIEYDVYQDSNRPRREILPDLYAQLKQYEIDINRAELK
jgi:hypothetical protein